MYQQGQVFELWTKGMDGEPLWAYRHRLEGRESARPQVEALDRLRRSEKPILFPNPRLRCPVTRNRRAFDEQRCGRACSPACAVTRSSRRCHRLVVGRLPV
jgi:hypothetical protein